MILNDDAMLSTINQGYTGAYVEPSCELVNI